MGSLVVLLELDLHNTLGLQLCCDFMHLRLSLETLKTAMASSDWLAFQHPHKGTRRVEVPGGIRFTFHDLLFVTNISSAPTCGK
eukprot:3288261-Amphidinium_carterae.1